MGKPAVTFLCTVMAFLLGIAVGVVSLSRYSKDRRADAQGRSVAARWEGQLVACSEPSSESGRVYLIEGGEKHWVFSAHWITIHGYRPNAIMPVPAKQLALIPAGNSIE
jgi:hypothetical protein